MKNIKELFPLLPDAPKKVVITMHSKPDADAMGSSLGLYHFLKALGHEVTVISPTNWAQWLDWMPGCNEVLNYEAGKEKALKYIYAAEWIFCLDFNTLHRTKHMAKPLAEFTGVRILIDHHQQPEEDKFIYGISDTSKSSTCEMVYDVIVQSGNSHLISKEIAECLYGGLVSDTGSFRFPATSANVHLMAADLKGRGLVHTQVHENLFDNFYENRLRFVGHILSNRLQLFYEYNTALIAISKADLLQFEIKTGDTEGLVNFPLSIKGIKLAALVIDRDEERKWSFRSKNNFDTNTFARTYFEGGGHFNASGGRSSGSLEETVKDFMEAIKTSAKQLQ